MSSWSALDGPALKEVLLPHCNLAEGNAPLYGRSVTRLSLGLQCGYLAELGAMPALQTLSYGSYGDGDDEILDDLAANLQTIGGLASPLSRCDLQALLCPP